jgi:predicted MFS family arabinose efflux permease
VTVEFVQIPASTGYGFGASVTVAGVMLVPLSIATFVASRGTARIERLIGPRAMIPFGCAVFALANALFAVEHRALWEAFVDLAVAGLGYGVAFAVMPGLIVGAVASRDTGSAMGFYQVLRSIGLSLGSALSASLLKSYTHGSSPFPSVGGYRAALIVGATMGLVATVVSYALPTKTEVARRIDAIVEHPVREDAGEADGTGLV